MHLYEFLNKFKNVVKVQEKWFMANEKNGSSENSDQISNGVSGRGYL